MKRRKKFGWTHAKSFGSFEKLPYVRNEFTVAAKDGSTCLKRLLRSDVAFANRLVGLRANWICLR